MAVAAMVLDNNSNCTYLLYSSQLDKLHPMQKTTQQSYSHLMLPMADSTPHLIGNTIDLTFELLLRLPVASVLRFRTVSKLWLSLSISPHFLISHSRHHLTPKPSALLLHSNETYSPTLLHIPLTSTQVMPTPSLAFVDDDLGIRIIHSCNGLLLCYSNYKLTDSANGSLYVLNPTINSFTSIPYPKFKSLDKPHPEFTLVFNPADALEFKLVCVWSSEISLHSRRGHPNMNQTFRIELFSLQKRTWRLLGVFSFQSNFVKQLVCGVFWHDAVHWLHPTTGPLCFDLKTEKPKPISTPPVHKADIFSTERFAYLGVCNDQLSLVEVRCLNSQFLDLLQLNTHESTWQLKHHISIDGIGSITCQKKVGETGCHLSCLHYFHIYSVLSLVEKEEEEGDGDDVSIVLAIPGKIISFCPKMNTMKLLCSLPEAGREGEMDVFRYQSKNAHKLIHSFAVF